MSAFSQGWDFASPTDARRRAATGGRPASGAARPIPQKGTQPWLTPNTTTDRNRIRYRVVKNGAATKAAGVPVYTARVDISAPYNLEMVAKEMAQGRFPFSEEDIVHVLTTFSKHAQDLLLAGNSINVGGLVTLRPSIRGTFESEQAGYSEAANTLRVTASVGKALRYATAGGQVMKLGDDNFPVLEKLINAITGDEGTLTSQGVGTLVGKNLNYNADAPDEGLYIETASINEPCTVTDITPERIAFRTGATFASMTPATLVLMTRNGNAAQQLPSRVTLQVSGVPVSSAE